MRRSMGTPVRRSVPASQSPKYGYHSTKNGIFLDKVLLITIDKMDKIVFSQAARCGRIFQEIGSVWDSVAIIESEDDYSLAWNMYMYRNYVNIGVADCIQLLHNENGL